MCELASEYIGREVICKHFEELDYEEEFGGVWACASLLHVRRSSIKEILEKINHALIRNGILYTSFKYGTQERIMKGRYFSDYDEKGIRELFQEKEGWKWCTTWITSDVRSGREQEKWLNVIVKKQNDRKTAEGTE